MRVSVGWPLAHCSLGEPQQKSIEKPGHLHLDLCGTCAKLTVPCVGRYVDVRCETHNTSTLPVVQVQTLNLPGAKKTTKMRRACLYTAMLSLSILLGFSYRSSAFVTHPGASASNVASSSRFPSSSFCSACQLERRLRGEQHPQLKHEQGRTVPQQLDWRHRPGRSLRHVLFLER